jgi:hypothetical protein
MGSFRTLLDIDSRPLPGSYEFAFSLKRSVHSRIGPISKSGGISVDEGWMKATTPSAGSTHVEAKKVLKFSDWGGGTLDFVLNTWVGVFLEVAGDEAYEGVCCRLP